MKLHSICVKNYIISLFSVFALALIFSACGGGSSSPAATPDTTAPSIISSSPADSATKVSVISDIVLTISESLDSSTATTSTVTLKEENGSKNLTGAISYNDTAKTITFNPTKPFSYSITYQLTLSGVKDAAGNSLLPTTISFTTFINPQTKYISYTAGAVNWYYSYSYDANGNMTQFVYYNGAGTDGNWFTAADVVSSHSTYSYDANGNQTQDVRYTGAGTDTTWFTADDDVNNYASYSYDANGNQTQFVAYTGAGADNTWLTADDDIGLKYEYDTSL